MNTRASRGNAGSHGPGARYVLVHDDMAAFDDLPRILRDTLNDFPVKFSSLDVQQSMAQIGLDATIERLAQTGDVYREMLRRDNDEATTWLKDLPWQTIFTRWMSDVRAAEASGKRSRTRRRASSRMGATSSRARSC